MKMLKKFLVIIATLAMLATALFAVSCEDNQNTNDESEESGGVSYYFTYNGTKIALGDNAETVLSKLGGYQSMNELGDCGGLGKQIKYTYSSFSVYVLESDGKKTIDQIDFKDDNVKTAEGVYIGMDYDTVKEKCGEPTSEPDGDLVYSSGNFALKIEFENKEVKTIAYIRQGT